MKTLLLSLFFIFSAFIVSGQISKLPIDGSTGKVVFTFIEEPNITKDELFKNAQTWITKTFGDYKAVIQFEDKESGKLILKGISPINISVFRDLSFSLEIDIKDSKYRCIISQLKYGTVLIEKSISDPVFTPIENFADPETRYLSEIEKLNTLSENNPSKKEIKKINDSKLYEESWYERNKKANEKTISIVDNLKNSLADSMQKKDDF